VFERKDSKGFNIVLQALPLDGKIVCREIVDDEAKQPEPQQASVHSIKIQRAAPLASTAC
jgi:hypothetical protein